MALREFVKLPTEWIEQGGLGDLRWKAGEGADNIAALMTLMAIAHAADEETGLARMTYDHLEAITHLSRAKVSNGLDVLEDRNVIDREPAGRSTFQLVDYGRVAWGKLPAKGLYRNGGIAAFADFSLRKPVELNAMKLYFLVVARRGRDTNVANLSYDKITEYSGIDRAKLRGAISLLAAAGLVHVEQTFSGVSEFGISNAYRLAHMDPYFHAGTTGRRSL